MKKRFLLTLIAFFICQWAVVAQNYDRYNYFHDEAVKLKNEGKLNEAKEKFKKIKVVCKGGIPEDNDLDKMIRECTTLTLSVTDLQFDAKGSPAKQVTVKTNAGAFKASSNSPWCKVNKKGNAVSVSCDKNVNPTSRTTNVVVSADGKTMTFDVTQFGGQLEFSVNPGSVNFSKKSDTIGVYVTTNADSWDVDEVPYWVEYQLSDSVLYLMSEENLQACSRADTFFIVILEEYFPVAISQEAADTIISADKKELVFPSTESMERMKVETNLDSWRVKPSDASWIQVMTEREGVIVKVQASESLFPRHGWVQLEAGSKSCIVPIHQFAYASPRPQMSSEINTDAASSKGPVKVNSIPSDLKVTIMDDAGETSVRYTPFEIPVDYGHYSLMMGFEPYDVFANERQEDVLFKPGLRFATLTWSPKALGMMSGFVGAKSWGAYTHFQANTPFVSDFTGDSLSLNGYNITFGPVYRPNFFPYVGAYAGVGIGGYVGEPHVGIDYEGGVMGFYKNVILTLGFHTSRLNSTTKRTSFMMGVGGHLKRYYDDVLGYCSSDSRRWLSLNYISRSYQNGKGLMVGDIGDNKTRAYIKMLYLLPGQLADAPVIRNIEGSAGVLFTPVNGIIDLCVGASVMGNITGLESRYQGIGAEVGTILNIWRFPITIFLHENDLFDQVGGRHLCVDFGIGFHLGDFGKSKCTYL